MSVSKNTTNTHNMSDTDFIITHATRPEDMVDFLLDSMESERDSLIARLRYLETVLIRNGRITRRTVTNRSDNR